MNNQNPNPNKHNQNNGNNNNDRDNSSESRHDWKDDIRETITEVATEALDDARDLAVEAKEEVVDIAREAKAKFDAIPPAKKMELNHWTSILIAVVIGLIVGLGIGWSRGQSRGLLMQHNRLSSAEMMRLMSSGLDGLSGDRLEQRFIADMIAHHQGAIDMSTKLVGGANLTNDQLRIMAANIIATQSAEIEQLKAMQK